jgi:hypothetical protein
LQASKKRKTHDLLKPSGLITKFLITKSATGPIAASVGRQRKTANTPKSWTAFRITVSEENPMSSWAKIPLYLKVCSCHHNPLMIRINMNASLETDLTVDEKLRTREGDRTLHKA